MSDKELIEELNPVNLRYELGWKTAKRLFLQNGEIDRERDNVFEENTDEWHGFRGAADYLWQTAVE